MTKRPAYQHFAILLASALVASCASQDGGGETNATVFNGSGDSVAGDLLATVNLSSTHGVRMYRLPDGTIAIQEVGGLADVSNAVDFASIARMDPVTQFRSLAGPGPEVPSALLAIVKQGASHQKASSPAPPPPEQALPLPSSSAAAGPASGGLPPLPTSPNGQARSSHPNRLQSGLGAPTLRTQDATSDANWWDGAFCDWTAADDIWCPVNVTYAHSGYGQKTMYYETAGAALDAAAGATLWYDYWNGTAWTRAATVTVAPRTWARWVRFTNGWYRSGIDGNESGAVAFSQRIRWATPAVNPVNDFPSDSGHGWTNSIQGVTHDANAWYVTNEWGIMKFDVSADMSNTQPRLWYSNPWGGDGTNQWLHMGDLAYGRGLVFVGLEPNGGAAARTAIGVLNTDLAYLGAAVLPAPTDGTPDDNGSSCPWAAYNPVDGLLYSSAFSASYIYKYSIVSLSPPQVAYQGAIRIADGSGNPIQLPKVQGAEFSSSGKMYLVSEPDDNSGGVHVIDVYDGRDQAFIPVQYDTSYPAGEELEGITIWDLDDGAAPGIGGQIHVLMNDVDWTSDDDLYFKHYRAANPSQL